MTIKTKVRLFYMACVIGVIVLFGMAPMEFHLGIWFMFGIIFVLNVIQFLIRCPSCSKSVFNHAKRGYYPRFSAQRICGRCGAPASGYETKKEIDER